MTPNAPEALIQLQKNYWSQQMLEAHYQISLQTAIYTAQ